MTQGEKITAILQIIDLLIIAMSQNNDVMRNVYLEQAMELRKTIV